MKHRLSRRRVILGVIFAVGLTPACSAEPVERSGASTEPGVAVRSFAFEPGTVRVDAGATVVWSNEDDIAHTVTSGKPGEGGVPGVSGETEARPDGRFDEPLDGVGDTVSVTFEEPGTYPYYCAIHDGMTGIVEVA